MTTITVKPEEFGKTLQQLIAKYGDEAYDISVEASKKAARETVKAIKGSAPSGGDYARSWSHKAQKDGFASYNEIVYNRRHYQWTHLLENPHDTGGGGHYPKNVDYTGTLAQIEEEHVQQFMEEVMRKL